MSERPHEEAHNVGDGDKRRAHPRGCLNRGGSKHLLVARRQTTRCDPCNVCGTRRPHMTKGLDHGASRAAWGKQMFGRRVTHMDHALAEHNTPGRAVGEIRALRRHLRREAKCVHRARAIDLQPRVGLAHQRLRNNVGRRRKRAKLCMNCGEIVQATGEAAERSLGDQPRKRLINGSACTDVQKVLRREDAPPTRLRARVA